MMYAIGRKRLHFLHLHLKVVEDPLSDVIPRQASAFRHFLSDCSHQSGSAFALHWKHGEKVGIIEGNIHLAVDDRSDRLNIREVVGIGIGSSGEIDLKPFPQRRACSVATGKIRHLEYLVRSRSFLELGANTIFRKSEIHQFSLAFDMNINRAELLDEHLLMKILGKDQRR